LDFAKIVEKKSKMHNHSDKKDLIIERDIDNVALVGNPNVGKSVIFGILTGRYVTVSNYPGTTVEVTKGESKLTGKKIKVIDTPGVNSLIPMSEDEKVTRDILLNNNIKSVIQVADAKNLKRALYISLQLAEMGIRFNLVLNMIDEAGDRGISINVKKLSEILGVDVIPTVAIRRRGIDKVIKSINSPKHSNRQTVYDEEIEYAIQKISEILPDSKVSKRAIALMILSGDESLEKWLNENLGEEDIIEISNIIRNTQQKYNEQLGFVISQRKLKHIENIVDEVFIKKTSKTNLFISTVGNLAMHRYWGVAFLILVLYATYWFVGLLGAGTLVDFLETVVFGQYISPFAIKILDFILPFQHIHHTETSNWILEFSLTSSHSWNTGLEHTKVILSPEYNLIQGTELNVFGQILRFIHDFLVGGYGVITMALSYGFAIVLPIVGTFFIAFSILEDSGYLPRLAVMMNKIFKLMGLNGKAILPMVLGLGCDTMATMTTRILETKKERIIVTLLLALGVPCSAQLGVILGMLAGLPPSAIFLWLGVISFVMILVGYLSAKIVPGRGSDFVLELPPIRVPQLSNILIKTMARIEWYLREVVPLFILGTAILFFFDKIHLLALIERVSSPLIEGFLGLPAKATEAFLIGFLRRDYGAAGLYNLAREGFLNNNQIVVSLITITLFIPCIANFFMIVKEQGLKIAVYMTLFIFPFAFLVGGILNFSFRYFGINF
jgi:ferrous iron transport protein B